MPQVNDDVKNNTFSLFERLIEYYRIRYISQDNDDLKNNTFPLF